MFDVNRLTIENAEGPAIVLQDHSTTTADGSVSVYFRGIEAALIRPIEAADVVVG